LLLVEVDLEVGTSKTPLLWMHTSSNRCNPLKTFKMFHALSSALLRTCVNAATNMKKKIELLIFGSLKMRQTGTALIEERRHDRSVSILVSAGVHLSHSMSCGCKWWWCGGSALTKNSFCMPAFHVLHFV